MVESSFGAVWTFAEAFRAFCVNIGRSDHVDGRMGDDGTDIGSRHSTCAEAGVAYASAGGCGDEVADEGGGDDSGGAEGCQEGASGGMNQGHGP